jgi:hypothetical protein
MKKSIFTLLLACMAMFTFGQETLSGWTFPRDNGEDSLNANLGTEQNMGYDIRFEDDATGEEGLITFSNGVEDFAATAEGWNNGADTKYWSVKFKAAGYKNFKVSSMQRAGGNKPGPRDWKLQYRLSGEESWSDIANSAFVCANDWETGVVENLPLPAACNNPASSVYVRWIITSNFDINGDELLANGISKIDNILITGVAIPEGDTLSGWTFPTGTEDDLNANMGTEQNMGYDIRMEDEAGNEGEITFTNGILEDDFAATAVGWDNGADNKFWSIKIKAAKYRDFRVSSKQRAGGNKPGPKDWKLQYRLSGQDVWTDIPNGDITVANEWTTGVVEDLMLPEEANYPISSVYIRWIMTSNLDINGDEVLATGVSKIDDILITGISPTGITESIAIEKITVFPNPCTEKLFVDQDSDATSYAIYNLAGQKVAAGSLSSTNTISIASELEGMHLVSLFDADGELIGSEKIVIK